MSKKKNKIEESVWGFIAAQRDIGQLVFHPETISRNHSNYRLASEAIDPECAYEEEYFTDTLSHNHARYYRKELEDMGIKISIGKNGYEFTGGLCSIDATRAFEDYFKCEKRMNEFDKRMIIRDSWDIPLLNGEYLICYEPYPNHGMKTTKLNPSTGGGSMTLKDKSGAKLATANFYCGFASPESAYIEIMGYSLLLSGDKRIRTYYMHRRDNQESFSCKYSTKEKDGDKTWLNEYVSIIPLMVNKFLKKITPYWEFAQFVSWMWNYRNNQEVEETAKELGRDYYAFWPAPEFIIHQFKVERLPENEEWHFAVNTDAVPRPIAKRTEAKLLDDAQSILIKMTEKAEQLSLF